MDTQNNRGQIIIEVSVVMLVIALAAIAAISNISTLKKEHQKYQFTKDQLHAPKNTQRSKK